MPTVVAFISQKGGVGKSTLARSLAVVTAHAGLNVKVADLDPLQRTVIRRAQLWETSGLSSVSVGAHDDVAEAIASSKEADLLLLDMPGQVNDQIVEVSRHGGFLIQPTSPGLDDIHPSLLVFQALENLGIPRERLAFALCRVLSDPEGEAARTFLSAQGYTVLSGRIREHPGYRRALNSGRGLTETGRRALNVSAQLLVGDILQRVAVHGDSPVLVNPTGSAEINRQFGVIAAVARELR